MSLTKTRLLPSAVSLVACVLLLACCGGNGAESTEEVLVADLSDGEQSTLAGINSVFSQSGDLWDGFSPADYPTVVGVVDDSDQFVSAFVIHHPDVNALGSAKRIVDNEGLEVFYVEDPDGISMPANMIFDFKVDIGGVPTYTLVSRGPNGPSLQLGAINLTEYIAYGSPGWQGLALHEMFHIFQIDSWNEAFADQNRYDFEPENFELAMLEDQALVDAYNASGDDVTEAIRRFVALRETRLDRFPTTQLDESQEASEGTAQWLEWRAYRPDDDPWVDPVIGDLSDAEGFVNLVAELHGANSGPDLSRFYLTGATILELLDREGIAAQERIEMGESPSAVLRGAYEVDPAAFEALIADARAAYDPDGKLQTLAESWALIGGNADTSGDPGEVEEITESESIEIDDEVIACLEGFGISFDDLADGVEISEEVAAACL